MTKPTPMNPPARRALLEEELAGIRSALEPAETVLADLRERRKTAIRSLLALPEDHRPTASEVARLAGVSHVYVGKLKPDLG